MIASIICISLFLYLIFKHNQRHHVLPNNLLVLLIFLKAIGAYGFYALYTYYYGNGALSEDAGSFIQEARMINDLLQENSADYWTIMLNLSGNEEVIQQVFANYDYSRYAHPEEWINSTRNAIKFISVLLLISGGSMFFVFLSFSIISVVGIYGFWSALVKRFSPKPLTILLFVLPSLLLWNSSMLREVIGLAGLLFMLNAHLTTSTPKKIALLALGAFMLLFFKPIWFVLSAIALIIVLIRKALFSRHLTWKITTLIVLVFGLFSGLPQLLLKKTSDKQFDFINVAKGGIYLHDHRQTYRFELSDSSKILEQKGHWAIVNSIEAEAIPMGKEGAFRDTVLPAGKNDLNMIFKFDQPSSQFDIKRINNNWTNLFKLIPTAFTNVWLRPYPWENQSSVFIVGMGVENVFLLMLFLWSIWKMIRTRKTSDLQLYLVGFIVMLTLAIGLVTPVTGAIVRYRIPIHLMIIILFISTKPFEQHKWLKNMFS